jgi:DNA-binding NtrC family response regulator
VLENSGIVPIMQEKLPRVALVVDDESLIRWSVSEALTDAGWAVAQASTGADARRTAAELAPGLALIVVDLRLPDVSDLSLVRHLRATYPAVPVILITAYGTADQTNDALKAGVYRVVDKPFDVGAVVAVAEEAYTAAEWPEDASLL